ncbi:MAG: YdjY domain-containing protein [Planctomycetota bacterium]
MSRLSPARPGAGARSSGLQALVLVALCLGLASSQEERRDPLPEVDRERRVVRVPATLHLKRFREGSPPGHHLVTWGKGRAGQKALLETPVPDAAVLDALEALGAKPGDNLRAEAWTKRADPEDPAPDARAAGPRLELAVVLPDGKRRPLSDLVEDLDRHGFEWRLAGNRALIPVWRSGCVVCLQSCPGSKVANARATMRDLERGRSRFRPSKLAESLGEGARLVVEISFPAPPAEEKTGAKTGSG